MAERVRRFDWASTYAGAIETWPEELRSASRTVLLSSTPMSLLIGRDGLALFNDAVHSIFGTDFHAALGQPVATILPGVADFYDDILASVFVGRPSSFHDVPLTFKRDGRQQKAWFDLDFTPIVDAQGRVRGALAISVETTARVQALLDLQRSQERLDLALQSGGIVGTWELNLVTSIVHADERFARLHGVDPERARLGIDDAEFVAGIHPDDVDQVMKVFELAKIDGRYRCQHRVVGPDGIRWIICSGRFRYDAESAPVTFSGIAVDVTEQVEIAAALSESEKRFRTYAETLPHVIFTWDRDGVPIYMNRRWYDLTGKDESDSSARDWPSFVHPDDRPLVLADYHRAIETGTKHDATARLLHHPGEYRWMRAIALPIRDAAGSFVSWIGTLTDVHNAKLLDTERELVARELDHRIKNFFAVAQGLVSLTSREDHTVTTFAERLKGRLATLHRSYSFIRSGGGPDAARRSHSLHELIRQVLKPYEVVTSGSRSSIEGDDIAVDLGKVTAFALVFHELATNAAKYGAFRTPDGYVLVRLSIAPDMLRVTWTEDAASSTPEPNVDGGFGSKLINLVIEGQLHGRLQRITKPGGLEIILSVPIDSIEPSRPQAPSAA